MSGLQTSHNAVFGEALSVGFQNFVKQTSLISVPYTTIVGRAQIPDIANDLRASFGIERIPTQSIVLLQNEFGASGEPIYSVLNDDRGLIRCVGGDWASGQNTFGTFIYGSIIGDYIEVTFYGTGLNLLVASASGSRDFRVSIDGGSESSNICPVNYAIIEGRGYNANIILPVTSGLSLAIHTVKIRLLSSNLPITNFEILNSNATGLININPGIGYINGQKTVNTSTDSIGYNKDVSGNTILTNGKGGRIVRYLSDNDSISHVYTTVPLSPSYLTNTNHTNEEVARTYYPREFGAGRSTGDDFSLMGTTNVAGAAFTLDDGTTTLVAANARQGAVAFGIDVMATTGFLTFTFVGTGLDVYLACDGGPRQITSIQIDGAASIGSISMLASTQGNYKICSGLPYGTHTVKFTTTYSTATPAFNKFIVYQPLKPILPSSTVEVCDYNIVADYNGTTATTSSYLGNNENPVGIINKINARELIYVGTWNMDMDVTSETRGGWRAFSSISGDYFQYTFFGTGVNLHLSQFATAGGATLSITIDGSAAAGGVGRVNITNNGSGNYTQAFGSSGFPCRVEFTGLALGIHTIKVTKTNIYTSGVQSVDVITPIHSYKSNLYADLQNTLPVGSNSLMDSRKTSMIKETILSQKAWAQAVGVTSSPTVNVGGEMVGVACPDMSLTLKTSGGPVQISFTLPVKYASTAVDMWAWLVVDGAYMHGMIVDTPTGNYWTLLANNVIVPMSAGVHKIDLFWGCNGVVMTTYATYRRLVAREL
jgi:hypothetical protein